MQDKVIDESSNIDANLRDLILQYDHNRRSYRLVMLGLTFFLILVVLATIFLIDNRSSGKIEHYIVQTAARGQLVVQVTATGNLQPTNEVNVGSELSGIITKVYVSDDDHVKKGDILAELDASTFEDAAAKSRAEVSVAESNLEQVQATEVEARIKLSRYQKVEKLSQGKTPSRIEMDSAQADLARAKANVLSAQSNILQAKAVQKSDETQLKKTIIRSPINGMVLSRAVDPGQAVASSLQAVTLFTLAEDLSKMELKVNIDEADVGQVKAGLSASFTVDAWPDRHFDATITRVGFNASNTNGVISYPAVLSVNNDDLSLRPGMTGTANIITLTHENTLLIPNEALRFTPSSTPISDSEGGLLRAIMPHPPAASRRVAKVSEQANAMKAIWVLRAGQAFEVPVKTGMTDGHYTEIIGGDLKEGDEVITESVDR